MVKMAGSTNKAVWLRVFYYLHQCSSSIICTQHHLTMTNLITHQWTRREWVVQAPARTTELTWCLHDSHNTPPPYWQKYMLLIILKYVFSFSFFWHLNFSLNKEDQSYHLISFTFNKFHFLFAVIRNKNKPKMWFWSILKLLQLTWLVFLTWKIRNQKPS